MDETRVRRSSLGTLILSFFVVGPGLYWGDFPLTYPSLLSNCSPRSDWILPRTNQSFSSVTVLSFVPYPGPHTHYETPEIVPFEFVLGPRPRPSLMFHYPLVPRFHPKRERHQLTTKLQKFLPVNVPNLY